MLGGKLVEITDDSNEAYTADNEMKFKTIMPKSSLCEYIDACMLDKGTVSVPNTTSVDPDVNKTRVKRTFRNCEQFSNCITETNNKQIYNIKDIDVVMAMYNLLKYIRKFILILQR